MKDWSPGSLLIAFVLAVLVPALLARFTLGRKGGHHLFDRDGLTPEEIRRLPLEMARRRTVWSIKGLLAALVAFAIVLVGYPLACLIGLPVNVFGISREKLLYALAIAAVLGITLGPALWRKWRGH